MFHEFMKQNTVYASQWHIHLTNVSKSDAFEENQPKISAKLPNEMHREFTESADFSTMY